MRHGSMHYDLPACLILPSRSCQAFSAAFVSPDNHVLFALGAFKGNSAFHCRPVDTGLQIRCRVCASLGRAPGKDFQRLFHV